MSENVTEIFGCDVFNDTVMKERLPEETYKALRLVIDEGGTLTRDVANVVANAMKEWAIENGATHYTHWFHPLTGVTAEKHDSFIEPAEDGKIIMEFSGKELIKGEADASSFPSGGLRATFEARGYTAWDCTSPAFLREAGSAVTLCIPTIFCSYTGETLDKKTPLLRSIEALSAQAVRIMKLFGYEDVNKVSVSVGPEQEYFLVDKSNYREREDLVFTGRTLFGTPAPKGQELDDHYYGSIKERVSAYMRDLNVELWKLGILAKTQHNEVAPAQHELAPIYNEANIATDHNQLVMDAMKKIAKRHDLECLLHEKPFAGVNGSGKHDNWSIVTNTGKNLLNPGKIPNENFEFLLFMTAVIQAVDRHADLLRLSASNVGNDYRLGADEAPPAIISIFLGEQLEDLVDQLIETGEAKTAKKGGKMNVGVKTVSTFSKDATDRNRTSPFAFTGNKFEFRTVGSSMSIAEPNTYLNAMVAETLKEFADELEAAEDFNVAVHELIKRTLTEHSRIIFNGNGYSKEWAEEAARRGLPAIPSFVDAIPALTTEKAIKLFEGQGIYSEAELYSRSEIYYDNYCKVMNIEARTMIDMVSRLYIPTIIEYKGMLASSINETLMADNSCDVSVEKQLLKNIAENLKKAAEAKAMLIVEVDKAKKFDDLAEKARHIRNNVFPVMAELRAPIDELETMVPSDMWPVPSYAKLMYDV